MASLLFQTIEQISREKHIEPDVIVAAIEDAMVVAARKYYRTEEDLRSKFNPDTGHIDVFSVRAVVEEVTRFEFAGGIVDVADVKYPVCGVQDPHGESHGEWGCQRQRDVARARDEPGPQRGYGSRIEREQVPEVDGVGTTGWDRDLGGRGHSSMLLRCARGMRRCRL